MSIETYKKTIEQYSGEEFLDNFSKITQSLYTELDVLTFAFILYDENTPEYRKFLRDPDYWDALDAASGKHMVVFTMSDKRETKFETKTTIDMMTSFSPKSISSAPSKNYSTVMKTLFDDESLLVFPSVLFFQINNDKIHDYRLVPLRRKTIHDSFLAVQELLGAMNTVFERVESQFYGNQREIFDLIKNELLNRKFTMYILRGPATILDLATKMKKIAGFLP